MSNKIVCVVGLGYVGLPLAIEFGKRYKTIGFDINKNKIIEYIDQIDLTGEVSKKEFKESELISFTNDPNDIKPADYIIIAVPTPIHDSKTPNLNPLISATKLVAKHMKLGSIIIYESTVYPYATQEVCIPILEKYSTLKWKEDFNVGYSPERINPGDKEHTLTKIMKIVSGDTDDTLDEISYLYESIIDAGVYEATSIEVAESAKVIENIQRDVNIALMNELSIIFNKLNIDTIDVLKAANTKWNFLDFRPGLVGGHCIGIDPYYLTYKAEKIGYHPEMILAGRRINDGMSNFIVSNTIKNLIKTECNINGATIGIFGITFKADCSDLRNSKVFDIIDELKEYNINLIISDPYHNGSVIFDNEICYFDDIKNDSLDAAIIAVDHDVYFSDIEFTNKLKPNGWIIDIKSIYTRYIIESIGFNYWRL